MNDDDMCSARDMEKLEKECRLVNSKCYLCDNCIPQAGYAVPHCTAYSTKKLAYKLTGGHVRSGIECPWFVSKAKKHREAELLKARMDVRIAQERLVNLIKKER